jgi:hypothetical protein
MQIGTIPVAACWHAWGLARLTPRVDAAKSFAPAIRSTGSPRDDTPESLHVDLPVMAAAPGMPPPPEIPLNEHQKAMALFSEFLSRQMPHPVMGAAPAAAAMEELPVAVPVPSEQAAAAKQRVESFLAYQRGMRK